ncbi:MAG: oligosaccharide flippase family protein [Fervidobacterium sp.]
MKNRVFKNYLAFSIGTWVSLVISFFSTPITSYLIPPGEFGKASLFYTIYSLVSLIVQCGTLNSLIRFYYKYDEKNALFYSSILIPFFGILFVTPVLFALKEKIDSVFQTGYPATFVLAMLFSLLFGIIQQYTLTLLRVQQKGVLYSFLSILTQIVNLTIAIIYSLFINKSFYALVISQLVSYITVSVVSIFLLRELLKKIKIDLKITKKVFMYGYPFLFTAIVWWIVSGTDKIMIRFYKDFSQLGLYAAANKLVAAMGIFTSGFNTMWYPYVYEKYEKEGEGIKERISKIFNYVSFLVVSLSVLLMSFKDLIFLLFAKQYRNAASISPFLLTYPAIMSMAVIVARGIDFKNKTYWFIVSDTFGAVSNVILNILLIPVLGARGAAIASGVSYFLIFLVEFIVSQKLFYVLYDKLKVFFGIVLLYLSAIINTFFSKSLLLFCLNVFIISVLLMIYKTEALYILKNFKNIIDVKGVKKV